MLKKLFYVLFLVFTLSSCAYTEAQSQKEREIDNCAGEVIDELLEYPKDPSDFLFRAAKEDSNSYAKLVLLDLEAYIQNVAMHTDPKDLSSDDFEYQHIVIRARDYAYYKLYIQDCDMHSDQSPYNK